jgi:hypothetical protein
VNIRPLATQRDPAHLEVPDPKTASGAATP